MAKTVTMVSPRAFRIHLGKESGVDVKVQHDYPYFEMKAGENEVPTSLVDHWAMKAHGVKQKE